MFPKIYSTNTQISGVEPEEIYSFLNVTYIFNSKCYECIQVSQTAFLLPTTIEQRIIRATYTPAWFSLHIKMAVIMLSDTRPMHSYAFHPMPVHKNLF